MHTLYFWQHTSALTCRRARTRYRLSEEEASHQLIDPKGVDAGAL